MFRVYISRSKSVEFCLNWTSPARGAACALQTPALIRKGIQDGQRLCVYRGFMRATCYRMRTRSCLRTDWDPQKILPLPGLLIASVSHHQHATSCA